MVKVNDSEVLFNEQQHVLSLSLLIIYCDHSQGVFMKVFSLSGTTVYNGPYYIWRIKQQCMPYVQNRTWVVDMGVFVSGIKNRLTILTCR